MKNVAIHSDDNIKNKCRNRKYFMSYEISVSFENKKQKMFLQNGFYDRSAPSAHIHRHIYGEIHVISGGGADFTVGDETVRCSPGDVLAIPGGIFHTCVRKDKGTLHTAFQTDAAIDTLVKKNVGQGLASSFFEEISRAERSGDHARVAAYIRLICLYLWEGEPIRAHAISDSGFLINEFFSNRYAEDIRLAELASLLHLSERQTQRLVREHTGMSFTEKLTCTRMRMARELKRSGMPMSRIAEYVGYRSYAGFWKAWQGSDEKE